MAVGRHVPFDRNKHPRGRGGRFIDVPGRMKALGGVWNDKKRTWTVPREQREGLAELLRDLGLANTVEPRRTGGGTKRFVTGLVGPGETQEVNVADKMRAIDGVWNPQKETWTVPRERAPELKALLADLGFEGVQLKPTSSGTKRYVRGVPGPGNTGTGKPDKPTVTPPPDRPTVTPPDKPTVTPPPDKPTRPAAKFRTLAAYHKLAQENTSRRSMAAVVADAILKDAGLQSGRDYSVTTIETPAGDRLARISLLSTSAGDRLTEEREQLRAFGLNLLGSDRVLAVGEFHYSNLPDPPDPPPDRPTEKFAGKAFQEGQRIFHVDFAGGSRESDPGNWGGEVLDVRDATDGSRRPEYLVMWGESKSEVWVPEGFLMTEDAFRASHKVVTPPPVTPPAGRTARDVKVGDVVGGRVVTDVTEPDGTGRRLRLTFADGTSKVYLKSEPVEDTRANGLHVTPKGSKFLHEVVRNGEVVAKRTSERRYAFAKRKRDGGYSFHASRPSGFSSEIVSEVTDTPDRPAVPDRPTPARTPEQESLDRISDMAAAMRSQGTGGFRPAIGQTVHVTDPVDAEATVTAIVPTAGQVRVGPDGRNYMVGSRAPDGSWGMTPVRKPSGGGAWQFERVDGRTALTQAIPESALFADWSQVVDGDVDQVRLTTDAAPDEPFNLPVRYLSEDKQSKAWKDEVQVRAIGQAIREHMDKFGASNSDAVDKREALIQQRVELNQQKRAVIDRFNADRHAASTMADLDKARAKYKKDTKALEREVDDITGQIAALHDDTVVNAERLREILREVRPGFGSVGSFKPDDKRNSDAWKATEVTARSLPGEWVQASKEAGELKIELSHRRGQYAHSFWGPAKLRTPPGERHTMTHELGHRIQYTAHKGSTRGDAASRMDAAAAAFHARRTREAGTTTQKLQKLRPGHGYSSHEVANEDKYFEAYVGREYGGDPREIWTMGLESVWHGKRERYGNLQLKEQDPEFWDLIVGMIAGVP